MDWVFSPGPRDSRVWTSGQYTISTCYGNEKGIRRTNLEVSIVFVVEHFGKWLEDCASFQEATEYVQAYEATLVE